MPPPDSEAAVAGPPAAPAATPQAGSGRGIVLMLLSVGLFAVMDAMIKWLGGTYPTAQLIFFRSLFAFVPLGIVILGQGARHALIIRDPLGHLLRAAVGIVSMTAFFYAFAHMPLADVVAISFAAPLLVTALSVPLLGEKVGPRRWSAVLVGFVGVVIMIDPGEDVFGGLSLVPLLGAVCLALALILVRRLSRTETNTAIVFSFTVICTLASGALLPFQWVTPEPVDLALLIGIGLIGGLAQIMMTLAFRHAEASVVIPFEYSAMIWAGLFGFLIWGEVPGLNLWVGVAIVVASSLYIAYREANLGLRRGIARRLQTRR